MHISESGKRQSGYLLYTIKQLLMFTKAGEDNSSEDDVEEKMEVKHMEATSMFQELLLYLEWQDKTSPAELLTIKQLWDWAVSKQASKLR